MVEENEYRSTYKAVNRRRCIFEKTILSRRCSCIYSNRFYLADREGISCDSEESRRRCERFLGLLRENARFALHISSLEDELPHAKEIKVQNGGLLGLQRSLRPELHSHDQVDNITGLIRFGEQTCGSLEKLPYREIVKSIVHFEGRKRPRSRR